MNKIFKKIKKKLGLSTKKSTKRKSGFELLEFKKSDGSFDYEKYKEIQIQGNLEKINSVWVREENISFLADYIKEVVSEVNFGLCHGTRRGKEQEWFSKYLNADVLGTEISNTAAEFPNTIQWDFHEVKEKWLGKTDFIYSNSFDHTYDPKKCLDQWMSCVSKDGMCIIEHSSGHEQATKLDPFGSYLSYMPYLILKWGEGKYCVTDILTAPSKKESLEYINFLIVRHVK